MASGEGRTSRLQVQAGDDPPRHQTAEAQQAAGGRMTARMPIRASKGMAHRALVMCPAYAALLAMSRLA